MTGPALAGAGCEAVLPPGLCHLGQVRPYVRICPEGHLKHGSACDACAGNGSFTCAGCGGRKPAILIPAGTWGRLTAVELDLDAAVWAVTIAMDSGQPPSKVAQAVLQAATARLAAGRELTAEGAGPLLDERCRAGDCEPCPGAPCEHSCHSNAKEGSDAR